MKNFTKCKIAGPAKAVDKTLAAIALVDSEGKNCLLVPVEPHKNEIFVSVFCVNANFPIPLVHDFLSDLLMKIEKIPGYRIEELRLEEKEVEEKKYVSASIIFEDCRTQELRVEDALALAGRNNWKINVQTSLLSKNDGNVIPQKNPVLVSEMKDRRINEPDNFKAIDNCCGWNFERKN